MDLDLSSPFGEILKAFRQRQRLTQQQLAGKVGIHRNTISGWERGDYFPENKTIVLELIKCLHLDDLEARHFLEASLTSLAPFWGIPALRNPLFTGREALLATLHSQLCADQTMALTQSYVVHGLGGIGKTQLAVEYAYRYALSYRALLWIAAESVETILASFLHIAELLKLPEQAEQEQHKVVRAVHRWLTTHREWLLIWDNVEDMELLQHFLPPTRAGAILITTRRQALGSLAHNLELPLMMPTEGMVFLLRRAKRLPASASEQQLQQFARRMPTEYAAAQEVGELLGGLPLALDQAGAYIEESGCSFVDYHVRYTQQKVQLLARRGTPTGDHPHSVATTFRLIWQRLERDQKASADLLRMCAWLHAEAIPEELFLEDGSHPGPGLAPLTTDPAQFDLDLAALRAFSLVKRHTETRTFSLHRLVQVIMQEEMNEQERIQWQQCVIHALNALFPKVTYEVWGQCERLLPHVLVCVAAIPDQVSDQQLAEVVSKAADYLRERAQYEQAEALYQRALRIWEQTIGPDHPEVAFQLNGLANIYRQQGKHSLAESFYRRALHIWKQTLGSNHPQIASILNNLALLSAEQGEYEQAELLYQRALHIQEQTLEPDHPEVARLLNNLANLYEDQGKYEQAEPLYQRALRIREQVLGPDHPRLAYPMGNLALLYITQGKYEQAELLLQRSLGIREQALGPDHPHVSYSLNGLALLYYKQGKYKQAETLFQRGLRIWEQTLGLDYSEMAYPLTGMADLYHEQGENEQAEPLYQRALRIMEEKFGPDYPHLAYPLTGMANLYRDQKKFGQAESLYQRAQRLREQTLGPEHPQVAFPLNGLATLYREQGRYEEAESLYQRVLTIREQHLGQQHPETAQTLHDLAICVQRTGHLAQAVFYTQRALSIRSQVLGTSHPKTTATHDSYVALVRTLGQQDEEKPWKIKTRKAPYPRLREERERRGWSQKYVAAQIGAERYYISRWERGIVSPSPHYRQQLCTLFGKDAKELGLIPSEQSDESSTQNYSEVVPEEPLPFSSTHTLSCWNVPYRHNPFFTGRTTIRTLLYNKLHANTPRSAQLPLALTGLGGMGKTQVAIEYAYHYRAHYQAVLWLRAESYEMLLADCRALMDQLHLPGNWLQEDQHLVIASMKRWLAETSRWLLILDNVEDPGILIEILPTEHRGHTLLTTRAQTLGTLAEHIALEKMSPEEGSLFLLRRIRVIRPGQSLSDAPETLWIEANEVVDALDGLPLALDQAGAYIEESGCGLSQYLKRYQARSAELLSLRGSYSSDYYQESVMTTLSLSIEKLTKTSPAALDLLRFCSFLSGEAIPEEIASTKATRLGQYFEALPEDPFALDAAVRELHRFSLIERNPETHTLSLHRLVQIVVRESLEETQLRLWAERVVLALNELLPDGDLWADAARTRWQRCLAHVFVSAALIQQWHMLSAEAIRLLYQTGVYLLEHARYYEAESIYRQALAICQEVLGHEHPQTGEILNDLALLFYYQSNYLEAEPLYQQALAICKRSLGEGHAIVAHIRHNLALLYHKQGNYALAERLHQKTLSIRESVLGPTSLPVAESLHALASLYMSQQNFSQADAFFQRALTIRLQALGAEHPLVAQSLTHLGKLYADQGNRPQAEQLLLQALSIREKTQGPDHPQVASCLHALGDFYLAQGKITQAEHYLQRALRIRERILPPEHTQRQEILHSLAELAQAQANKSEHSLEKE